MVGRRATAGVAGARARRPGGRRLDQWDDGAAQGGGVRPCQPRRGGAGHRRAQPAGGPPTLSVAVRGRGLHDAGLGRDRQRGHHSHHADAVAGRRGRPDHGRGEGHRGPGRADAVGAHARQRRARTGGLARAARCGDGRSADDRVHRGRGAPPLRRPRRRALHVDRGLVGDRDHTDVVGRGGGDDRGSARRGRRAGDRRRRPAARSRRRRGPGPAAFPGHDARVLGQRPGPGAHRRPAHRHDGHRSRPRRRRLADHGRLRAPDPRGKPPAVRPGPRALHPGRLQRLPGRGRGGPLLEPRRGEGRRRRRARRRARRSRCGCRRGAGGCNTRAARAADVLRGSVWPTTRHPTCSWWSTSCRSPR